MHGSVLVDLCRSLLGQGIFWLLACASPVVAADPLIDLTLFNPPGVEQRKLQEPVVTWIVNARPSDYCANAAKSNGYVSRPEGCAYWSWVDQRCVVVTGGLTTHSELGHLFIACLKGSAQQ